MTKGGRIWRWLAYILTVASLLTAEVVSLVYYTPIGLYVALFALVLWVIIAVRNINLTQKHFQQRMTNFLLIAGLMILLASCFTSPGRYALIEHGHYRVLALSTHGFVPFWDKVSYLGDLTLEETVSAPLAWGQGIAWKASLKASLLRDPNQLSQVAQLGFTGWKNQLDTAFESILQERVWKILRHDISQTDPICPLWFSFVLTDEERKQFEVLGYQAGVVELSVLQ